MTITISITINRRFMVVVSVAALLGILLMTTPVVTASIISNAPLNGLNAQQNCPKVEEPKIAPAAIQLMEKGWLIWIGDPRTIYVLYYDPGTRFRGTFETYPENWEEGEAELDKSMPTFRQPTRGIGKVWRNNPKVKDGVGWGVKDADGYMTVVTKIGDKIWFNGHDSAFKFEGKKWEEVYAWRPSWEK